jgi:thymidylate synthase (FAD)
MLDRTDEIDDFKNMSIVDFCRNVIDIEEGDMECISDIFVWEFALKATEWSYNTLMNSYDWKAQQARTVLPCAINSPLIKTAFISDWKHFFNLRAIGTTGAPHPQAKELAEPLMEEFIKLGLIDQN